MDAFLKEIDELKKDPEYLAEELVLDLTSRICQIMTEKKISRADLARRLGTSRAFVTSFLNGKPNMTVTTLARVAHALEVRPAIQFLPLQLQSGAIVPALWFVHPRMEKLTGSVLTEFFRPHKESIVKDAAAKAQVVASAA